MISNGASFFSCYCFFTRYLCSILVRLSMKIERKSRENTVALKNKIVLFRNDLTPMCELSSEQLNRMFPAEVSCIGCGQLGRYTSIGCLLIAQCCPQLPKAAQMAICSNNCKNSCAKGKLPKTWQAFTHCTPS